MTWTLVVASLLLALAPGTAATSGTVFGPARFSVISDSLIRLELGTSPAGAAALARAADDGGGFAAVFDERPTLSYPGGRPAAQAKHTVAHPSADVIRITTDELVLRYDRSASGGAFTNASLSITLLASGAVWRPGDADPGNLRGTRLDIGCYATFESCYSNGLSPGPLSTSGWSLMDDTTGVRMQTENNPVVGFPWFDASHPCDQAGVCSPNRADSYFFGHGHRYRAAMRDFALVSGKASLPPRVAFGVWWSTWYNFTSCEKTHKSNASSAAPVAVCCCCWWRWWCAQTVLIQRPLSPPRSVFVMASILLGFLIRILRVAIFSDELTHTILDGYKQHGLPLDVVVMDMEWHTVEAPSYHPSMKNCTGWGGYTWNEDLIPDPLGFQKFLHSAENPLGHPLATSLNGHSQSGIGPCQANYSAFAKAIGKDPANQALLACDMANATWTQALFDTMLDPKGIDYWWTDYGGCASPTQGKIPLPATGGCPVAVQKTESTAVLLWSNMIYDSMISKTGRRPLVLSRYGGIGNQRYGIGFSGDTESAWPTLRYQVEMTSTAANVLQAYWSHDIGGYNVYCPANAHTITPCPCGHVVVPCNITLGTCKRADGELYARWLQFGSISPIMRTHCSHCDRRIWVYPEPQFKTMKAAMVFRNAIGPYLYTAGRFAYDHAIAAVHPMYYDADVPEAYSFAKSQYMLGDALMAAPITESAIRMNASAGSGGCGPKAHVGCVDAHWANHGLFATDLGNSPDVTLHSCASECGKLSFSVFGVGWGGVGHGSQCLCGNQEPPAAKLLKNDPECSRHPCSGNMTENCGGNWRTQVYTVDCGPASPPVPSTSQIWVPPGTWLPWNASRIIHGGATGTLLQDQAYELDEIPLFAKAGAVVPTQTMAKAEGGPLVWIVFPGAASGMGTNYDDDGNTTGYEKNVSVSWATLKHSTVGAAMTINISGTHRHQGQMLQLRQLAGAVPPTKVASGGVELPKIAPPTGGGESSAGGWWVVPAAEDSLWLAAGSVMVSLPAAGGGSESVSIVVTEPTR